MSEQTIQPLTHPRPKPDKAAAMIQTQIHWRSLLALVGVMVVYGLLAFNFSQVTPFNKGPDEGINLDYIKFINAHGRLPITYAERDEVGPKSNWPALYHLSIVGLGKGLGFELASPPEIKIFWDSFRYRAIDTQTDEPWYLHTEDQSAPYYGPFLALQLGRWLSILFSLITLVLVYLSAQEILPGRPWLALAAVTLLAFIPQFIFVSSAMNEDALVAMLATLYFWLLIRLLKQPEKLWLYAALGLTLGLSVTAKYTTIVLPLEIGLVLAVLGWQQRHRWVWWGQRLALVGGGAVLASSWWFGWNFWFLNEIKTLGVVAGLLRPLFTGGTDVTLARMGNFFSGGQIGLADLPQNTNVGTFSGWVWTTALSFWGVNIGNTFPLYPYAYGSISLVVGLVVLGVWKLWRSDSAAQRWLLLLLFHIAIFVILPLVRFGLSRRLGQTAQGRHILIPAAAAVAILLVWGLAMAVPIRWQRWVFSLVIAGFVGWTVTHIYRLDSYVAPLLPIRTIPQAAEWLPNSIKAQFGETVELVSFELKPQPEQGQLEVELAWRALLHSNESYLLKVMVLDAQQQVVSHWLGYNGQGRLPTLAWDSGDSIFDRLVLPLPNLPAGNYTVEVQLVGTAGPLPVSEPGCSDAEKCATSPVLNLGSFSLNEPSALSLPQRLKLSGVATAGEISFALWSAAGPALDPQPPTYRYPATISVIVGAEAVQGTDLELQLVDAAGQAWPADNRTANVYTFVIGPRWSSGNYTLKMVTRHDGQVVAQATSEPLLAVENWWQRDFTVPAIASPAEANFAGQLKFLGYTLPQMQVKAGEAFPLTLYWQALPDKAPQANFVQFNHLLDSTGKRHGGYDRLPLEYYSTLLWAPGEVVADGYAVPVEADAPPGQYYLNVGYYLTVGEAAVNLPLVENGQMTEVTAVTIGPIEVVKP